ncbi:hypothetical protein CONPUDRAFT_44990 [Coniophora puteana RWD-64-598 SS2]|uniref:Uncharacterized protein n=1 Tax=Coniophora puteana (strain RWD-64-598) TaxID=741705 RepID=A0A5M3N7E3_CONPW|nr:uncharacterized protein CONPUDRAFT_44990 [Coniophora puteana RWD-64-598 SS2]EIW86771.1 hypothetical protein CONPUDRAFT_44990 [Coniophora puteana RWD-64-598 SS2]
MAGLPPQQVPDVFEPKPAFRNGMAIGLQAGAIGAFISAVQNALGQHSAGAAGFLTRTGGTIGTFAAMGAAFAITEATVANQREKEDAVNGLAGGCAAGFLAGLRTRSLPIALGSCAVVGAAMGTFDYAGELAGRSKEEKEEKRRKFFKPVPQPTSAVE